MFYKEIALWFKGHNIDLLPYDDIKRNMNFHQYSNHLTTNNTYSIFSFLSWIDVFPPILGNAQGILDYSADNNGALILFKLML